MKFKSLLYAATLAATTLFGACDDDISDIGSSLSDGTLRIFADTLDLEVPSQSIETSAFDARTATHLIGRLSSDQYGDLSCSFLSQMMAASTMTIPDSIDVSRVDSVKMIFAMPRGQFLGDSLAPQQLAVYRLTKQLPSDIKSNFDPTDYYSSSSLLGTKTYTLSQLSISDTVITRRNDIRLGIDLPVSFGRDIFTAYREHPETFAWPSTFNQFFPGIYVTRTFGSGCVANARKVEMMLYYHYLVDDIKRIQVKENFLQTNADYYNASVFKAPFDDSTVNDINSWVNENTDTMIPEVLNKIDDSILMYLINAVAFDAKWLSTYCEDDIWEETFTTADGSEQIVEMMHSEEYCYLEDENATGFFKYYNGKRYAFLALLPNEDISVTDYVNDLTPEYFQNLFAYKDNYAEIADVAIPKFKCNYQVSLKETLSVMGMPVAFSDFADFSGITETTSRELGDVSQITFIDISEKGTRAAAVTIISDAPTAAPPRPEKSVILNRPFVYSIVDTENNLPIFLGVLNSVPQAE